jgi:hypothetical protein
MERRPHCRPRSLLEGLLFLQRVVKENNLLK